MGGVVSACHDRGEACPTIIAQQFATSACPHFAPHCRRTRCVRPCPLSLPNAPSRISLRATRTASPFPSVNHSPNPWPLTTADDGAMSRVGAAGRRVKSRHSSPPAPAPPAAAVPPTPPAAPAPPAPPAPPASAPGGAVPCFHATQCPSRSITVRTAAANSGPWSLVSQSAAHSWGGGRGGDKVLVTRGGGSSRGGWGEPGGARAGVGSGLVGGRSRGVAQRGFCFYCRPGSTHARRD